MEFAIDFTECLTFKHDHRFLRGMEVESDSASRRKYGDTRQEIPAALGSRHHGQREHAAPSIDRHDFGIAEKTESRRQAHRTAGPTSNPPVAVIRIIEIREATKPIASTMRNAYVDFTGMTLSVVAVMTNVVRNGKRVIGYGFNSNGRYGQGGLIRERFAPRLLEANPATLLDHTATNLDPDRAWYTMMQNEKPGGHGERSVAVGAIDMALWDLVAKMEEKPLFRLLAERHGRSADPRVFVYAAGGYYHPTDDVARLRSEMRSYVERGYTVVKMKIGGLPIDEDQQRIEAVLDELDGRAALAVDANGRFGLDGALAYARMLSRYPIHWYEEAGDPLDFETQRKVAESYDGALATGENLFSHQDAANLIRYGGLRRSKDWLQFDCALSYGLCEYKRTLTFLATEGWSWARCIPHGGHQLSLNIAAGLGLGGNESYPDLFQPFGGFPDEISVVDGHVLLPELPGIGFEGKGKLADVLRELAT
jgi:L-alanine-DL-glutamate epimerase-like enolase superfamily enzyme